MAKLTNDGTAWTSSVTQTTKTKKYTFSTKQKYIDKNIELTVDADIVSTVASIPTTKQTSIIYNSSDGKYYLWR